MIPQYDRLTCRRRSTVHRSCLCSEYSLFPQHVVCAASTSFSVQISWRVIAGNSWFTYRDHTDPYINLQRRFFGWVGCVTLLLDYLWHITHFRLSIVCAVRLQCVIMTVSITLSVCVCLTLMFGSSVSNQSKRLYQCVHSQSWKQRYQRLI